MSHSGAQGVFFESDGHHLIGTLFLAHGTGAKKTAVLLHGLPGIEKNVDLALALRTQGWNSLIFHYRGFWGSQGPADLRTSARDVSHALDFLTNGELPLIDPDQIVVFGHSFGGLTAVLAAAQDSRIKAVIAAGAVADTGFMPITEEIAAQLFTPWLDLTPQTLVAQWVEIEAPVNVVETIAPRPLLIVHGEADADVPIQHAERLAERAKRPSECVVIQGADHGFSWHRPQLIDTIINWLDDVEPNHKP